MNGYYRGESRTKIVLQRVPWIKRNLHRNSLNYFREVSGCVVGRQKGELRSAGRSNFSHFPVKNDAGKCVNCYVGRIAFADICKLSLFVVRLNHTSPLTRSTTCIPGATS